MKEKRIIYRMIQIGLLINVIYLAVKNDAQNAWFILMISWFIQVLISVDQLHEKIDRNENS